MMSNILLVAFLILAPAVVVNSQLTIPKRTLGYVYRPSQANRSQVVTLTAYLDFTCIDSKVAYPTLLELADKLAGSNFELVVRSFSLPYHRNSHVITEASHIIDRYTSGNAVFPFLTDIYNNLDSLTTTATRDKTDSQVLDIIAPIATKTAKIPPSDFRREITEGSYDSASRLDFKYGCTRGIYGTPMFMVNDVIVTATSTWTTDQWLDVIKPLL